MTEPASLQSVLEQLAEAEKQRAEPQLTSKQRRARTVARLAAVQALYQMELAGEGVETVITEFSNHRFDADIEGQPLPSSTTPKPNSSMRLSTAWRGTPALPDARRRRRR